MDRLLCAQLPAQQFVGAIGDHFVDVHVGLGAGAGLPDHEREMLVELALAHLAGDPGDGAGAAGIERAELVVHLGGRALDDAERMDQWPRHQLSADGKILERTLGLRAPISVGGHRDGAEAVGLGAGFRARRGRGSARSGPIPPAVETLHRAHFLRKRSSRTTSPPWPPGGRGSGSPAPTGAWAGGDALGSAAGASAGLKSRRLGSLTSAGAAVGSVAARVSNCKPNCTEGSKKPLTASNGIKSRSGMPLNDNPTSNVSSVTMRSQNW